MVSSVNRFTIESFFKGAGITNATKAMQKMQNKAKQVAVDMNKVLGGKTIDKNSRAFGQNLSAISNRLGFMAFQWKFMAGAAQQAVDSVVGGFKRLVEAGAKTGDALTRALAFAAPIAELTNRTDSAAASMTSLDQAIRSLGSGKTIFGIEAISGQALELQKALDDIEGVKVVLPFAALLKTIDPTVSDEKLGTGLVSLFSALGTDTRNIKEVAAAMDLLSNVSDKSTANFQSSIASLSLASQQAKSAGFTVTDLGSIIQTVSDTLGKNKGGGRASGAAGRFANAFLQNLNAIADPLTKQGAFARQEGLDIFTTDAETGAKNFKKFIPLIDVFREKLDGIQGSANKAAFLSQLGLGDISGQTLLAILSKTTEELQAQNDALLERGTLKGRANLIEASGQSQLLRITAAVDSAKLSIVQGFRPALKEVADIISEIASNQEFVDFLQTLGRLLANELIPHVKTITKGFRAFFNFLKKNGKLIKIFVTGAVLLSAALAGLSIIATIGFFALVAAASIGAMSGQMLLGAASARSLSASLLGTTKRLIPFLILGAGLAILATALTGIFDDSLTPAIVLLGGALTALGTAMLFPTQTLRGLKAGFSAASGALTGFAGSLKNEGFVSTFKGLGSFSAGAFKDGFKSVKGGIIKPITSAIGALGKAGVIGAVIAVAATLIAAFILKMEQDVENSTFFKTGLADKWQQVGFRMTAATNVFLRNVAKAFVDFGTGIANVFSDMGSFVGKVLTAVGAAVHTFFTSGFDVDEAGRVLREGIEAAFGDFDLGNTLGAIFDPTGVTGALDEIRNSLGKLKEAGFGRADETTLLTLGEILEAFQVDKKDFDSTQIKEILDEIFGVDSFDALIPAIADSAALGAAVQEEKNKLNQTINKSLKKEGDSISKTVEIMKTGVEVSTATNESLQKYTDSLKVGTETEKNNTKKIDDNSFNLVSNSKTLIENIDFLKREIIEIAKNTNVFSTMTEMMLKTNLMWANLIAQGNRAAGKLSSLKVSKTGKFSIIDPGFAAGDRAGIQNASAELNAFQAQKALIDIESLIEELAKIQVTLSEANKTITNAPSTGELIELQGNRTGESLLARLFNNQDGSISVDLKVDSTIDVVVQQGGLTDEQIEQLTIEFGAKIADQLGEKLGVDAT